uniref:ORF42 n=1 Tax=Nitrosopumilaceae spindle-shaped virus TaxID=3065433 RepID=A0AAT9J9Y5_9VIRU
MTPTGCPSCHKLCLEQKQDRWSGMIYFKCSNCGKQYRLVELQ